MRAIRVHETGGAEVLRHEQLPVPAPAAGEALLRVHAAGVNFIDIYRRSGLYPMPLPAILGEEGAGTVEAVGDAVRTVAVGDRVAWASVPGAYAEFAAVPADRLVPLPPVVTTVQGAALMLQGLTAHYLAESTFRLAARHRCLVHAAAGGVGLLLVQIARRRGATVIATVGAEEKAELARAAGAQHVIIYTRQDFAEETRRLTDGKGVHVVYDSVGRTTFLSGLELLVPRGTMVLFGQSSGPVAPIDPQLLNRRGSLFLTRPTLGHYVATREELLARAADLFAWLQEGTLSLRIGAEYDLADVADAHRALEQRRTTGKVVLRVANDS